MDGAAVRGLAARIDAVARGLEADISALRDLQATDWVGPAAAVCQAAVGQRVVAAGEVLAGLGETATALRVHAAAADGVMEVLRTALATSGVGADHLVRSGADVLRATLEHVGPGAVGGWR